MSDTTYTLWCLVEGDDIPLTVIASPTTSIDMLKVMIKEERSDTLQEVAAVRLTLWKPIEAIPVQPSDSLAERVKNIAPDVSQFARKLEADDCVADVFQNETSNLRLQIIVRLPVSIPITTFAIKLRDLENWDHLDDDLVHNNMRNIKSQFLLEFQELLERKRHIDNAAENVYASLRNNVWSSISPDSYFERDVLTKTSVSDLNRVTIAELGHYFSILCGSALRNKVNYDEDKKPHIRALLAEFVERIRSVPEASYGFRHSLPFHLVIDTGYPEMRYTPAPDFHASIRDFPHLMLEVNSQDSGNDEYRMLLRATCISRIGNWLRAPTSNKPIVIMAIYIDRYFSARRYLVCQPDTGSAEVEYITKDFDLTVPRTAFEFIFQTYNFLALAKDDNVRLHRPADRLAEAKDSVAENYHSAFATIERHSEETSDTDASDREEEEDNFGYPSVQKELARAGYTTDLGIPKEFVPLTRLKPTIRRAASRSGAHVVLKIIDDFNERRLLRYFSGIKALSNHTIPLLDVIDLSIKKTILVLPWKSPLDEVLEFRDFPNDVVSLCLQFIEGVAFLHQHRVAHCDLKPENVVVDTKANSAVSPRLFIIDFELAQFVENEETMAQGWCGTPPWIAPELGTKDGSIRRYSPIRADRWACGRMIEYFIRYFPPDEVAQRNRLWAFAQRLLFTNPRARPGLDQLQIARGPEKRKSATSEDEPAPKRLVV